jgi:hypothetical protein
LRQRRGRLGVFSAAGQGGQQRRGGHRGEPEYTMGDGHADLSFRTSPATSSGQAEVKRPEAAAETPRDHRSDHGAEVFEVFDEWAWVELNYRPHAYQTAAERWPAMTSVDFPRFRPYLADRRWLALAPFVTTNGTTVQPVTTRRPAGGASRNPRCRGLENHNAVGRLASRSIEVELSRGPALNKTAASAHRPRPGLSDSPTREMSVVANKFEPILVRLNPRLLAAWQEAAPAQ